MQQIVMKPEKRKKWPYYFIGILTLFILALCAALVLRAPKAEANSSTNTEFSFDEDADFRVLEIVPCHGAGQIGYLVGGEEPIEIDNIELELDYDHKDALLTFLNNGASTGSEVLTYEKYYTHKMLLDEDEEASDYNIGTEVLNDYPDQSITEDGYYQKVADGEGLYYISGDTSSAITYEYQLVTDHSGTLILSDMNFGASSTGDYTVYFESLLDEDYCEDDVMTNWTPYAIASKTKVSDGTGEYLLMEDDAGNEYFKLALEDGKAYGDYNVTFYRTTSTDTKEIYYVRNDYQITPGTGNYINYNGSINSAPNYASAYTEAQNGDYTRVIKSVTMQGVYESDRSKGNYIWVSKDSSEYEPESEYSGDTDSLERIYLTNNKRQLRYFFRGKYINQEVFKKKILRLSDAESEDFNVDVLSLTPTELNDNPELAEEADLVYVSPKAGDDQYLVYYSKYGDGVEDDEDNAIYMKSDGSVDDSLVPNFYYRYTSATEKVSNDLSWEVVYNLFEAIATQSQALYMDANVYACYTEYWATGIQSPYYSYTGAGTSNNVAKLFLMVAQTETSVFYQNFIQGMNENTWLVKQTGKTITDQKTGFSVCTGYYNAPNGDEDSSVYWNDYTFLPKCPDTITYGSTEYYAYLESQGVWHMNTTGGGSHQFVHNNVATNIGQAVLSNRITSVHYTEEAVREYVKERDGLDSLPDYVDGYDALNYIINFRYTQNVKKERIKVLDLEPCYPNSDSSQVLTKAMVMGWAGSQFDESDIEIVTMSTAEFIGKTETLSETYDLIYMGLCTDKMNKINEGTTDESTVYNDQSMNGLIYTHVGDTIWEMPKVGGLLDREYVNGNRSNHLVGISSYTIDTTNGYQTGIGSYRFGGNDITSLKMEELKDYVENGYPLIVADDFYSQEYSEINTSFIDSSSYIYQFLNNYLPADGNQSNVINVSKVDHTKFIKLINLPKLEFTSDPQVVNTSGSTVSTNSDIKYLQSEDGVYYLQVEFEFTDVAKLASNSYDVHLYIDYNADGRYTESEEETDITITKGTKDISDSNGTYHLKTNTTYQLKCQMNDDYAGVVPYKLEIINNKTTNDNALTCSYLGYAAIQATTKDEINVLQITVDDTTSTSSYKTTLNLEETLCNSSNIITKSLQGIDDFEVNCTTITVTDFIKLYETDKTSFDKYWNSRTDTNGTSTTNTQKYGKKLLDLIGFTPTLINSTQNYVAFDGTSATSRLSNFDMIVIGFSDIYQDIDSEAAMEDLIYFADSGRSILFTHDTTSYINVPSSQYVWNGADYNSTLNYWGYNMNKILRNLVGMDRFGVTLTNSLNTDSLTDEEKNVICVEQSLKDKTFCVNTNQDSDQVYPETQGYTYGILLSNALTNSTYASISQKSKNSANSQYANLRTITSDKVGSVNIFTNYATKVNSGRITEYPYKIDDTIEISTTHAQYYQLDLEKDYEVESDGTITTGDGKSDVIVWYCLSDNNSSEKGIYSSSKNDVRNNYYIYSIGNVTYSGVGHSTIDTEDEAKLFVNTFVAAFRSARVKTTVSVDGTVEVTENSRYLYADDVANTTYDTTSDLDPLSEENEDAFYTISFTVSSDEELVDTRLVDTTEEGEGTTLYKIYTEDNTELQLVTLSSGEKVYQLEPGSKYHAYIGKDVLNGTNSYKLTLTTATNITYITMLRRDLFDLN